MTETTVRITPKDIATSLVLLFIVGGVAMCCDERNLNRKTELTRSCIVAKFTPEQCKIFIKDAGLN